MVAREVLNQFPKQDNESEAQYLKRAARESGTNWRTLETAYYRAKKRIIGKTAKDNTDFEKEILPYFLNIARKAREKRTVEQTQRIHLPELPCGVVLLADIHGGGKCDYEAIISDIDLIIGTDNLYCGMCGDVTDNFIIGKLISVQNKQPTTFAMEERFAEWFIEKIKNKLLFWISGNHDNWTYKVCGNDIYRKYLENVNCLYDRHQIQFDLIYGDFKKKFLIRHKFKYSSIFNPTHGQEVSWERKGIDFDVVIGAHTHQATLFREFIRAERKRLAIVIGTYKLLDEYASEHDYPESYGNGSAVLIFDKDYNMYHFDSISQGINFLKYLNESN